MQKLNWAQITQEQSVLPDDRLNMDNGGFPGTGILIRSMKQ